MFKICLLTCILTVGCSTQRLTSRSKPPVPIIGLQKLECSADPTLAIDLVCRFTRTDTGFQLNIAVTLLTRHDKFWIQIQQSKLASNKQYHPIGMKIEVEGCDAVTNLDGLLMRVIDYAIPNYKQIFKSVFHPCPYGPERMIVENFTIPFSFYEQAMFKGNIRARTRLFIQGNKTLFELVNYAYTGK